MTILLVRHGHAGAKSDWRGDDSLRPLTRRGWLEAEGIVGLLSGYRPAAIVSSPTVRCLQSVDPLARSLHLKVETCGELGPKARQEAIAFIGSLAGREDQVVASTHGEVIEYLQDHLSGARSVRFGHDQPRDKGSVWVLEYDGGHLALAKYLPPVPSG